ILPTDYLPHHIFYLIFLILSLHLFFLNDTAPTEIYTLSLHDALPICTRAIVAAKIAVAVPTHATTSRATPERSKSAWLRATMYTPAVTMVAAWMSAETGVGPSIASGSHVWSGSWADLPQAPMNRSSAMPVAVAGESVSASLNTAT